MQLKEVIGVVSLRGFLGLLIRIIAKVRSSLLLPKLGTNLAHSCSSELLSSGANRFIRSDPSENAVELVTKLGDSET